jgi:hypothetical protein
MAVPLSLYYTLSDGLVCFAPLVSALLGFGVRTPAIDPAAVADFLAFEHVLGDETLLRGVHALAPATIARISAHGVQLERYWTPRYRPAPARRCEEWVEEFGRRLGAATVRSVSQPPRVGLPIMRARPAQILAGAAVAVAAHTVLTYGCPVRRSPPGDEARAAGRDGASHLRASSGIHPGARAGARALDRRHAPRPQRPRDRAAGVRRMVRRHRARQRRRLPARSAVVVARRCRGHRHVRAPDVRAHQPGAVGYGAFSSPARRRVPCRPARAPPPPPRALSGGTAADATDAFNVGERHWRGVLRVSRPRRYVEFREPFDYDVADPARFRPSCGRAGTPRRAAAAASARSARVPRQSGDRLTNSPVAPRRSSTSPGGGSASGLWREVRGACRRTGPAWLRRYDYELRRSSRAALEEVVLDQRTNRGWYKPRGSGLVDDHVRRRRNNARVLGAIVTLELWMRMVVDAL